MFKAHPLLALLFGMSASPLLAEATMPLTYDVFEISVPHIDLETCPESLNTHQAFCRATMANDALHVFAFDENGDNPLVAFATFETDALTDALAGHEAD